MGSEIVYLNTDNAVAEFKKKPDESIVNNYFWGDSKELKYKVESSLKGVEIKEFPNTSIFSWTEPQYRICEDPKTNNFDRLIDGAIESKKGFQISGPPGVGKTTFAQGVIKELKKQNKNLIILAPSHKARKVIGNDAMTVHSFCQNVAGAWGKLKKVDYIIVDEKSMMKEQFINKFYQISQRVSSLSLVPIRLH